MRLDALFWSLVILAVAVTGGQALSGLPVLASALVPGETASGDDIGPRAYAVFSHPIDAPLDRQPQVLQPIQSHGFPDWMTARRAALPPSPQALAVVTRADAPRIAIVIDDMGGDVVQSRRAISLPKAISLSFLPYPSTAPELARQAVREGHEVLVHVPMEPEGTADPGPNALRTDLSGEENVRRLEYNLSRISGYDGVNNHEGSKFTSSRAALAPIIGTLAARHLFFLDSRTAPDTQVVQVARAFGVESAGRDVFLDDTDRSDAIDAQLRAVERVARLQGVAIAIGHPRANTMDALWRWCGEIASRGFQLVPVRDAVRLKTLREIREASLGEHH